MSKAPKILYSDALGHYQYFAQHGDQSGQQEIKSITSVSIKTRRYRVFTEQYERRYYIKVTIHGTLVPQYLDVLMWHGLEILAVSWESA